MSDAERQRRAADAERSALLFIKGGLLRPAEADLRRCVALRPDYAVGHNYLGLVLYRLGRLDDANQELEIAINLLPGDEALRRTHGTILEGLGRLEEAEQEYAAAASLDPQSGWAHAALGSLLLRRGDLPSAEEHLLTATRLNPGDAQALADLADIRKRRGSLIGAIEALQRALAILADFETPLILRTGGMVAVQDSGARDLAGAPYHYQLGILLDEAGDFEHAASELRLAQEHLPGDTGAVQALARVLIKRGRDAEVQQLYERAIKADPDHRGIYEADLYALLVDHSSIVPGGAIDTDAPLAAATPAPGVQRIDPLRIPTRSEHKPAASGRTAPAPLPEAIVRLQRAVEEEPNNSRLHRELSLEYMRAGLLTEAKEHARRAEQLRSQRFVG